MCLCRRDVEGVKLSERGGDGVVDGLEEGGCFEDADVFDYGDGLYDVGYALDGVFG